MLFDEGIVFKRLQKLAVEVALILYLLLHCDGRDYFGRDSCASKLLNENKEFQGCFADIEPFLETLYAPVYVSSYPAPEVDEAAKFKALCSSGVRQPYSCMHDLMTKCKDKPTDIDIHIDNDTVGIGEIILACSLYSGSCQRVLLCFPNGSSSFSSIVNAEIIHTNTVTAPVKATSIPPVIFQQLVPVLCGHLKQRYDCAISQFVGCVPVRHWERLVPTIMNGLLTSSTDVDISLIGEQLTFFMEHACDADAVMFERNSCVGDILESREYSQCYKNAILTLTNETNSCPLFDGLAQCTRDHVGVHCGRNASEYLVRNIPIYVKGVSRDCIPVSRAKGKQSMMAVVVTIVMALLLSRCYAMYGQAPCCR